MSPFYQPRNAPDSGVHGRMNRCWELPGNQPSEWVLSKGYTQISRVHGFQISLQQPSLESAFNQSPCGHPCS